MTDPSLFIAYLYQYYQLSPVHDFISRGALIGLRECRLGLHAFHSVEYSEHGALPSHSAVMRIRFC